MRNYKGFSAIEIVLTIAVIILGTVLALVYFNKTQNSASSSKEGTASVQKKSDDNSSTKTTSDDEVVAMVKKAYGDYQASVAKDSSDSSFNKAIQTFADTYATDELAAKLTGKSAPVEYDQIFCAMDVPMNLTFGTAEHGDNIVAVTVKGVFASNSVAAGQTSEALVRIDETHKIVSIDCPAFNN